MYTNQQSHSNFSIDDLMNEMLNLLEDVIDKKIYHYPVREKVEFVPMDIKFYIDYKQEGKASLSGLIDNKFRGQYT